MSQSDSIGVHQRALEQRYNEFTTAIHETLNVIATAGAEARKQKVIVLNHAARDLIDLLAPVDRPTWLNSILNASHAFLQNPTQSYEFLRQLVANVNQVQPLIFSNSPNPTLDFDALYARFRNEGRLPELFDNLISLLMKVIDSGEIDSITTLQALRQIVGILKANRNGSYIAARQSISVAGYLKNLVKVVLENIPLVKELIEAYDRTLEEAQAEFDKLDGKLKSATLDAIAESIPRLQKLPDFVHQSALLLPNPTEQTTPSNDCVDGEFEVQRMV